MRAASEAMSIDKGHCRTRVAAGPVTVWELVLDRGWCPRSGLRSWVGVEGEEEAAGGAGAGQFLDVEASLA